MFSKLLTAALLFSMHFAAIYPQTPPYYHYTSKDGLASSTVFHMIQDNAGYLWFGTLNGLSRFDGTTFITYRRKDGLNSNSITQIIESSDNKYFISNFERGINLLDNGKIKNIIEKIDGKYHTASYMIDYKEKIYAYAPLLSIIVLDKTNSKKPAYIVNSRPVLVNKLVVLPQGNLAAITHTGLYDFKDDKLYKINIKGLNDINFTSYSKVNDGSYLLGSIGSIYKIKGNTLVKKYKTDLPDDIKIENVFSDSKNNIWFSTPGKGFYVIYNGSDKVFNLGTKLKLDITHITNFLEDREGNIWITTFGKGVYCLNNLYLNNYTEYDGLNNNNINSITKDNSGRIIIGTYKGINILEKDNLHKLRGEFDEELAGDINNIIVDKENVYAAWSSNPLYSAKTKYKELRFNITGMRAVLKTASGYFVHGGWGNDIRINKYFGVNAENPIYPLFGDSVQSNRIYSIVEDSKNNIWVGSALGLVKLSNVREKAGKWSWDKTFYKDNQILNSRINNIYEDSAGNIWFAGSKGAAKYDINSGGIINYFNSNNYDLSSANAVCSDSKNRIWIGTFSGLYLLEGNSVKYFNGKTGLPADEVLSLFYDKEEDYLYIGTSNGLSVMNIKLFDSYVYPELSIKVNSIISGDSVYINGNNLLFEPDHNNIYMDFSVLMYSAPDVIKYRYKLNDRLLETSDNKLNLVSLQNGIYELEIAARTLNSAWGEPLIMKFEVLPKFYETLWFYALMLFVFTVMIVSIAARRIKTISKKNSEQIELNERINQLKHQALSSMMNPHFTFNALNSVQYLINSKRNQEANDYIAMMAKLIRKNLDTAGSGFILLSEEINRLTLYLNLEKLRFNERFSYEIINLTGVDADSLMIPNMIIQPFVENSLWHGIMESGKQGILTVSFSFEDVEIDSLSCRALIIKIIDNGIGYKEARKNQKADHISKGIKIIEERLTLLSEKMNIPNPIMFEDLSSRNNDSQGTEVIISLPPPLYKLL